MRKTSKEHIYVFITFLLFMVVFLIILMFPMGVNAEMEEKSRDTLSHQKEKASDTQKRIDEAQRIFLESEQEVLDAFKDSKEPNFDHAKSERYERDLHNAITELERAQQELANAQAKAAVPQVGGQNPTQNYYQMIESQNELDNAKRRYHDADVDAYFAKRRSEGSSLDTPRSAPYSPKNSPHNFGR